MSFYRDQSLVCFLTTTGLLLPNTKILLKKLQKYNLCQKNIIFNFIFIIMQFL